MSMLRQSATPVVKQASQPELIKVVPLALAARHWYVHRRTVEMAMNCGKISAAMVNGFWYVSVDDLNALWGHHDPTKADILYIDMTVVTSHVGYKGAK